MRDAPGGGDGGEVGIDPAKLADLNGALSRSASSAQSLVNIYIGKLSRCGMDTGRLSKAGQDLSWATGQLPMLWRRQSMAQAIERQDPGLGKMVPDGAGYLAFATDGAAQKAGNSDGTKAAQALKNGSNDDFITADLDAHADDPAYLAAFFHALGPHGLAMLGSQVTAFKQSGDTGKYQKWASLVGDGLATASYQMKFSDSWLNDIRLPGQSTQPLDLIQPFLDNGVYSPDWLQPLGQYALSQADAQAHAGGYAGKDALIPPLNLDGVWTAIAHNPAYDVKFYAGNFPRLSDLMTDQKIMYWVADGAFAGMVQAATIPPDPARFPGQSPMAYALNAQRTVKYFGDHAGARTSDDVRNVFGVIAMNYFSDLASSVRAAAPGIGKKMVPGWQISAMSGDWAAFVTEAMRDQATSAQLLMFYSAWLHTQYPDWRGQGNADVPDHQGWWNDFSLGVLDDFMAAAYQTAGASAGETSGQIAEVASAAGSAFLSSLLFGPEAGVADAALAGVQDGFQTGVEGLLNNAFNGDPQQYDSPDSTLEGLTGVAQTYSTTVQQWWNDGSPWPGPTIKPGQPGDPSSYIKRYGGHKADFLVTDGPLAGQLKNPLSMHPLQLAAYNAWLQDPAVVNANAAKARETELGMLSSFYAREMARSTFGG
ncbi:MAG TPA: hypothetical protein VGI64_17995 [Streptosporangiaceae bacterium]